MQALVIYDSLFGNTESIARAIAGVLERQCEVRLLRASIAHADDLAGDLLVVGGPTHRHWDSAAMSDFLDGLARGSLRGLPCAAFDTRYRMARWLTGSAAVVIGRRLSRAGGSLIDEPESFFIVPDQPPQGQKRRHELEHLEAGELERARAWATSLLTRAFTAVAHRR